MQNVKVTFKTLAQAKEAGIVGKEDKYLFMSLLTTKGTMTIWGGEMVEISRTVADKLKRFISIEHNDTVMLISLKDSDIITLKAEKQVLESQLAQARHEGVSYKTQAATNAVEVQAQKEQIQELNKQLADKKEKKQAPEKNV